MEPSRCFAFCPRCGVARAESERTQPLSCSSCGFCLYFNPAVAAAAILVDAAGRGLFIRRAKEPAKGALALSGGFIDIGETAEDALQRELREELGIEVEDIRFICSKPNSYLYRGVTYPVLDLIFMARIRDASRLEAMDDVASYCWLDPMQVNPETLAFPSMREGLRRYQAGRRAG